MRGLRAFESASGFRFYVGVVSTTDIVLSSFVFRRYILGCYKLSYISTFFGNFIFIRRNSVNPQLLFDLSTTCIFLLNNVELIKTRYLGYRITNLQNTVSFLLNFNSVINKCIQVSEADLFSWASKSWRS